MVAGRRGYACRVPRFCRHNRLMAECPICSQGTVLDRARTTAKRTPAPRRPRSKSPAGGPAPSFSGPYGAVGPYEDEAGARYEVRLEGVPGGLRLAEWAGGALRRRAPVLAVADLASLVTRTAERAGVDQADAAALLGALRPAGPAEEGSRIAASPGRAGELRDELRVEPLGEGRLRIARWVLRPGAGWELQDGPVLLPAARFEQAIGQATRLGLLGTASEVGAPPRL
jgi:hypothetical protein